MNSLQIFNVHHTCQMQPHHLGKSKKSFSTLLFIYFRLFTLAQKKTTSRPNCCSAALAVYLLLFSAPYYLHSPSTASRARYRRSVYGRVEACGIGLQRRYLNFSTAWCITRMNGVEKDWKQHVLMQQVITMNTCCDIACLMFQLPLITTGSFQSHRRQPKIGSFPSLQSLKERNKPSVR